MRRMKIVFVVTVILSGCATSNVIPTGKNSYLATVRFCGICTASAKATQTASDYCQSQGKVVNVTNISTVFGSGAADVRFSCSSVEDQRVSRPDSGVSTVEIRQ